MWIGRSIDHRKARRLSRNRREQDCFNGTPLVDQRIDAMCVQFEGDMKFSGTEQLSAQNMPSTKLDILLQELVQITEGTIFSPTDDQGHNFTLGRRLHGYFTFPSRI